MSEEKYRIKIDDKWFNLEVIIHQTSALTERIEKLEKGFDGFKQSHINTHGEILREISELKSQIAGIRKTLDTDCSCIEKYNNIKSMLKEIKDNLLKHRLLPSNFDDYYKLDGEKEVLKKV